MIGRALKSITLQGLNGLLCLQRRLIHRSAWRNCPKTPDSSKTRVSGGPEAGKRGPFNCAMAAIPTLETLPSDFLDRFGREILRSSHLTRGDGRSEEHTS